MTRGRAVCGRFSCRFSLSSCSSSPSCCTLSGVLLQRLKKALVCMRYMTSSTMVSLLERSSRLARHPAGFDIAHAHVFMLQYDHKSNPGPVPRSFIGPLVVSALVRPVQTLWGSAAGLHQQLIGRFGSRIENRSLFNDGQSARAIMGIVNVAALSFLSRRAGHEFGRSFETRLILLSAAQFHIPFWSTRTLPNMFAFPLGRRILFALWIQSPAVTD
jgi:hypothetical protein